MSYLQIINQELGSIQQKSHQDKWKLIFEDNFDKKASFDTTKIEFYVNDKLQYTYHKEDNTTAKQWPFDTPFHIILNQSGGAGWPGIIEDKDLPFEMNVDYAISIPTAIINKD